MQTLLEKDNITVFLPINGAFDSLPDSAAAMEFLQSDEVSETIFMLNSAELEILTAHKNWNSQNQ